MLTTALSTSTDTPSAVALDPAGNLYVIIGNGVSRISPSGTDLVIAGAETGLPGYSGDGGAATAAQLNMPTALAVDPQAVISTSPTPATAPSVFLLRFRPVALIPFLPLTLNSLPPAVRLLSI
jgi:hypothetical protein